MPVPESHHETDSALGPITDEAAEASAPTSRARENGGANREHDDRQDDLKRALNESRRSAARLRQIIDTIPVLAWCSLPDGSNEFMNQRWLDYTGVSSEEANGWGWKNAIHPEDLPRLMAKWETLRDHGTPGQCEARLRGSEGVFLWFLFQIEPVRDETGQVVRWYGTATDIEDRKQIESLRATETRMLEMIANGISLSEVLNDLCVAIDAHAPGVTSMICLVDGEWLSPCAGPRVPATFKAAITPWRIGPNRGSCGSAAFTKQRVIIEDISNDPKWPEDFRSLALRNGIRAAWSEPLISQDGEVLGTFAMSYGEPQTPDSPDLELIEAAGNIARIAIERERSQEALRKALDKITKSEVRLRRIIDTIPTLAWCSSPDGSVEFLNQRWHDYTGLPPETARGWGWQSAHHPDTLKEVTDKWLEFLAAGQPGEVEGRLRRFDGQYRWFLFRAHPLCDELGKIVNWYGVCIDIDDRKRAEEQLRRDRSELQRITDAISNAVIVLDSDGKAIYANRFARDYTGLTPEDLGAEDFRSLIFHPDDVGASRSVHQLALRRGVPFEDEQRALRKDGQYRWFLIRYNPLLDEEGNVLRWYATATDIDERKRNEDRTRNESLALREDIERSSMFEEIVGSSEALRKVLVQVSKVAPTDSTVLILGETGTGKELIARAIHNRSKRSNRAFIRVNCAAIPAALIASELFGHEKGSFTGALDRRLGRFESADGGTIFLDEVGELPAETQVALLRVLQEREFERVGGCQTVSVDVRVIAATNRDLNAVVAEGTFRQDLFYRFNVFPIHVPPLRERAGDISMLTAYLIDRYAQKAGKKIQNIGQQTMDLFHRYEWPGNIRELQNIIERAVILCEGETFFVDEAWLTRAVPKSAVMAVPLVANLVEREREMVEAALQEAKGVVGGPTGAAAKLGIPRQTLESKIRKLGINRYLFKTA
jgi:formate hydrogenlyase transcriptional activator